MAALGDKNVEMTAELADGWLPLVVLPEKMQDVFGPGPRRAGFAKRAPELGPLQITAGGILAIEEEMSRPPGRPRATSTRSTSAAWARAGATSTTPSSAARATRTRPRLSRTSTSTARRRRRPRRCPTSFIDRVTLIGPPAHVKERIAALGEAGVTHLHVTPVGDDAPKLIAQVKEWIS